MTRRVLITLAVLLLTVTLVTACGGTPTPPVKKVAHLQELVEAGQSLEQVQALMTNELWETATIYPSLQADKGESGNWNFKPKPDSVPGDTDAPFLVMLFEPDRAGGNSLAIIFDDGAVLSTEWFAPYSVGLIRGTLSNELDINLGEQ